MVLSNFLSKESINQFMGFQEEIKVSQLYAGGKTSCKGLLISYAFF
jgi:hypothetical protein